MENICNVPGEQFMWKAVLNDGTEIREFEEDLKENDIMKTVMDNEKLEQFGLIGNGFYINYNTKNGIFNLYNADVKLKLLIDGTDILAGDFLRNKVIMFRTAESRLLPNGGQTPSVISSYTFGHKYETEQCFVRIMFKIDMYEGAKIILDVTSKNNSMSVVEVEINGNNVLSKGLPLVSGERKEMNIPITF